MKYMKIFIKTKRKRYFKNGKNNKIFKLWVCNYPR